ncbi:MAG: alkaline phosphatase family protein [Acidimicrobiales bacterium]
MGPANEQPRPTLPDYAGANLSSLVPALLRRPGERPPWLPEAAASARQVVLLVLDGLGWEQLQAHRSRAPTLTSMEGGAITSVAPTTTATALCSICLGCTPAEHGLLGYKLKVGGESRDVLNVLRWRTSMGDARSILPPRTLQPRLAFEGRAVPVVSRADLAGSGFSEAHLGGSVSVGWAVASSIAVEVESLLVGGEAFVFAYYDGVDKVAHARGLGRHYEAELSTADRLVADVAACLPAGAALVVTADHGQVEVGSGAEPLDPDVLSEVDLLSGEARFRWLHDREGRAAALVAAARYRYGGEAWVRTPEDMVEEGWLGGPLPPHLRARLGDVAVVAYRPVAYLDPTDPGEARLVARHGSLTSAEVLVPLLAAGAG